MTRKPKGSLEIRALQFIRDNKLFEGINKLLLAVSGGPDSVCLLLLMLRLRNELDMNLHIAETYYVLLFSGLVFGGSFGS